jgi:type VI protein secretion system component VasK
MQLWQRLWLLFAVIWLIVAGLNIGTILAFSEGLEREKFVLPLVLAIAVPAASYLLLWGWNAWRKKSGSGTD